MRNILKEKLARGEKPLGTFVGTGSAAVVECLGCAGLDFAILDNEHSPIEAETTARLVCAAERRNITPLARVREISDRFGLDVDPNKRVYDMSVGKNRRWRSSRCCIAAPGS